MPNWLPYSQIAAASLAPGAHPASADVIVATAGGPAAQCRESTCNPVLVQKLKDGVLGSEFQTADPEALAQEVLRRGYQVNIGWTSSTAHEKVERSKVGRSGVDRRNACNLFGPITK